MSDLATYIGLYVRGDASAKIAGIEKGFEQLSTRGARHMGQLSRSMDLVGQGLDKVANRYTALLSGAAGVGAVRQVSALDERFTRLGINADQSREHMDKLKQSIFEAAGKKEIRVDPTQILAAVEQIVEKTGDLGYATDSLETLGYVIQATGAEGQHVGALVSEFKKLGIEGKGAILMAMDTLVTQGKAGAFTLQNLSSQGEKAVSAFAAMGYRGQGAVQAMGALLQVARMGTGSAEQATTAYENLLSTISKKSKELGKHGIQVFDKEAAKKGLEVFRPMPDILKEIITATKGKTTLLQDVFDVEAFRAITKIAAEYKDTQVFESLDKFNNISGDGTQLIKDSARAAGTFGAALTQLTTEWTKFADANLTEPVRDLADLLNSLDPANVQATFKALAWGVGLVGGLIALKKGIDGVRWGMDTLRYVRGGSAGGRGGVGGALGGGIGGPTPVHVVNMPMGGMGGAGGGSNYGSAATTPAKGGAKGLLGSVAARGGKMLPMLGRLGGAAAVVTGGVMMAGSLMDGDTRGAVGAGGSMAGGLAGAAAGAAIGSVVPVIGTVVGGVIGGALGAWGGEAAMDRLYDAFMSKEEKPTKVEGGINVTVTAVGGATAQVIGTSTGELPVDVGYTVP